MIIEPFAYLFDAVLEKGMNIVYEVSYIWGNASTSDGTVDKLYTDGVELTTGYFVRYETIISYIDKKTGKEKKYFGYVKGKS